MMLFRPTEDVAERDQCDGGIDEFVNSIDATTGAEVVGDSFRDLCAPARVLLCELRSPLAPPEWGPNSSFVWTYRKSRANGSLEMCLPPQCELRKFSPISRCY